MWLLRVDARSLMWTLFPCGHVWHIVFAPPSPGSSTHVHICLTNAMLGFGDALHIFGTSEPCVGPVPSHSLVLAHAHNEPAHMYCAPRRELSLSYNPGMVTSATSVAALLQPPGSPALQLVSLSLAYTPAGSDTLDHIPLAAMTTLTSLQLNGRGCSGTIPDAWAAAADVPNITATVTASNVTVGSGPKMTALSVLDLSGNLISATIPAWLNGLFPRNLPAGLAVLSLDTNQLTGAQCMILCKVA